ncbi:MAG: glycoside hydrolase family 2 protein [Ruminococcaceae bacterium]|nr:glycoside hydrolase family 2 protein [Oscillospiraceae bacterium]
MLVRHCIPWNEDWTFLKDTADVTASGGECVTLPHTWNATDGQDGGNDYFRGTCVYKKRLNKADLPVADCYFLEIKAANSSADVYVNGHLLAHHDGGYSVWRAELTEALEEHNEIAVIVDNAPNDRVYPQMADFTFYGGLYRGVDIIVVDRTHFALSYYGAEGLQITPVVTGADAKIAVAAHIENAKAGDTVTYTVTDREGRVVTTAAHADTSVTLTINGVHLWNGRKDPYLYTLRAVLSRNGAVLDEVSARFGCRTFAIDPARGFLLNGEEYPLRGVSRHQDRLGIGNALLPCHHEEDIELITEVGATAVRLAHYQHDRRVYDLCDEKGLVVWAEIPYISKHLPNGYENTASQMKELILQNYNHPSIVVWGLSNEITMNGAKDPHLLQNHRMLNEMVHTMDPTRKTAVAVVSMCGIDEEYVHIADAVAYNHYFGWYGGDTSMNGPWFDKFHAKYPDRPIGVSEYGCEGLNWHTSHPVQGDYTEEYQAYYHEELIKQLFSRPYLWATFVWNMFDFGADARAEGGEHGQNHKGLVTMDRKYKKDAFYAYKAWLSDEPFVHLCGKRYVERTEEITRVTVYSNQPTVELFQNGKSLGEKQAEDHFFRFDVPNVGESTLVAVAGNCRDEANLCKVKEPNSAYVLKEKGAVLNWFDVEAPAGRFSLNDTVGDILGTPQGAAWFSKFAKKLKHNEAAGFTVTNEMMAMLNGFTVLRLTSMVGVMGANFTKDELIAMNRELNQIEK